MTERNVMALASVISGYVQNGGNDVEAVKLFLEMIVKGESSYSSILKACANISDAELGEQVHARVLKSSLSSVNFVRNSLVSMDTRCGRMEEAFELFLRIENMDIRANACTFASLLSAAAKSDEQRPAAARSVAEGRVRI